jgi:hypothetical protein|tara:strand:+ start:3873 stop:4127 length:255 start_codon:yes stop_codon:yes gene_type:complete
MKKILAIEVRRDHRHRWAAGDLVKIIMPDLHPLSRSCPGIVVSTETSHSYGQVEMFPMINVFNFKTSQVDKIYSYNLEILSPHQ